MIAPGLRVIRGPDWCWGDQDGGEGFVGTVCEVGGVSKSPEKTVVVQWDSGMRTNYRIGYENQYDLRVVDNAQIGIKHSSIICDGCKKRGIAGMQFKCIQCYDFDLCSVCYHADVHDLSHCFQRIDKPLLQGAELPARGDSRKIQLRGIFVGAKVVRGPFWEWGNQDGGEGKTGRVMDIRGWDSESSRSVANVTWVSGATNVYRLGHKGFCDLKFIQDAPGGMIYPDHVPVLGQGPASGVLPIPTFSIGDKVRVIVDVDTLKQKQQGHGGWNPRMVDYVAKIGSVHRITDKGDIRVQYEGCINRWTLNPAVLCKVNSYSVGDTVRVIDNIHKVFELQRGHGEWTDAMKNMIGCTVKIIKIFADGDLKIECNRSTWTLNPLCVQKVPAKSGDMANRVLPEQNRRLEPTHRIPTGAFNEAADILVRNAAQGNLEAVKAYVAGSPHHVDSKSNGKTSLQVAAHQGHVQLVAYLLSNGANVNAVDRDGDTTLHYAAFGNQPEIMELLLAHGADINAVNKERYAALHIAGHKQPPHCVTKLLAGGADVNIQDSYGDTPLHDAIGKECNQVIELLCNASGVNFTLKNKRGFNVLHYAALKGNDFGAQQLLVKDPSLVDVKKDDGFSALHLAALNGHKEIVETLVVMGRADIDLKNNRNQTALLLAVSQGHCGVVEQLINLGANPSLADEDGDTALHVALIKRSNITEVRAEEAPRIHAVYRQLQEQAEPVEEHRAAVAVACFLTSVGCSLEAVNAKLQTALHCAPDAGVEEALRAFQQQHQQQQQLQQALPGCLATLSLSEEPEEERQKRTSRRSRRPPQEASKKPVECTVCSELSEENVALEPCGHRPACEDCSSRMKKCLQCGAAVHRRITKDGRVIPPKSRQPSAERMRYLECKIAEIEETHGCSICMERRRNVVFLCGHGACTKCAETLRTCHMCRKAITKKIPIY